MKKTTGLLICISITLFFHHKIKAQVPSLSWAKGIGANSEDFSLSIANDNHGYIYITGGFSGTVDFDPGPGTASLTSAGGIDAFVAKYDTAGHYVWAFRMGSSAVEEYGSDIGLDHNGNLYVVGYFGATADFDPGIAAHNLTPVSANIDLFLAKYDTSKTYLWAFGAGSPSDDTGYRLACDPSGESVYITGYFKGATDFDPGPGTAILNVIGDHDAYIAKYSATGIFVWAFDIGGTGHDDGLSIATDHFGNVYACGSFENTIDIDPGPGVSSLTSVGGHDVYMTKYDPYGNLIWGFSYGGVTDDYGPFQFVVDNSGYLYMTSAFTSSVDFDPGPGTNIKTSAGDLDIFLSKYGPSGDLVWVRSVGGSLQDWGTSLTLDKDHNIVMTGAFSGTVDFDPGPGTSNLTSQGMWDLYLAKFDTSGNYIWAFDVGSTNNDIGYSLVCDNLGGIYLTGKSGGLADFDPTAGTFNVNYSGGVSDVYIAKYVECQAPGNLSVISGNILVCPGSSNIYSVIPVSGATSYVWSLPGAWAGTSTGNTIAGVAGNSGLVTVMANSNCGSSSAQTLAVTVVSIDTTVSISGTTLISMTSGATYQWVNCATGYTQILGATAQIFTPSSIGDYAVIITKNGCVDTSACNKMMMLGIGESNSNLSIVLSPNPSKGNFVVTCGNSFITRIEIFNVLGQSVYKYSEKNQNTSVLGIELPSVPSGIYFMTVQSAKETVVRQIAIE